MAVKLASIVLALTTFLGHLPVSTAAPTEGSGSLEARANGCTNPGFSIYSVTNPGTLLLGSKVHQIKIGGDVYAQPCYTVAGLITLGKGCSWEKKTTTKTPDGKWKIKHTSYQPSFSNPDDVTVSKLKNGKCKDKKQKCKSKHGQTNVADPETGDIITLYYSDTTCKDPKSSASSVDTPITVAEKQSLVTALKKCTKKSCN